MKPRMTGLLALVLLLSGCAAISRPLPREVSPAPLTEEQRRTLESRRDEIRQELLAMEHLPEITRVTGANTMDDAVVSLEDQQNDVVAHYLKLKAQLQYIEALLR
ncbi:MAG TPA: hypothetical protein VEB66_12805 [Opitutaceae bacterium]|nr:hypothetical protein [Opitutaceae bacterium]